MRYQMKCITIIACLLWMIVFVISSFGQNCITLNKPPTIVWDANVEPDLAGYSLHFGLSTRHPDNNTAVYTRQEDVGNVTTFDSDSLRQADGTYFVAATAVDNATNRSDFSNEVCYTLDRTAPDPPGGLNITIHINISMNVWGE